MSTDCTGGTTWSRHGDEQSGCDLLRYSVINHIINEEQMADAKAMAAQIAALGNQIKQLKDSKKSTPSKVAKGNKSGRKKAQAEKGLRKAPAAQVPRMASLGMSNLLGHTIRWICGTTRVGNGTVGVTDQVYFRSQDQTIPGLVPGGGNGAGMVPVLAADTGIGQAYVRDIEKHYARKVIKSCKIKLVPVQPSTANSCQTFIAPVRGAGSSGDTVPVVNNSSNAPTVSDTMGMAGVRNAASWEEVTLDMTPFLANGGGARQNEYQISRDGANNITQWGTGDVDLDQIAPCAFVIAGVNGTTAMRGTDVHYVIVEQVIDLLDFIGGNSILNPLNFTESTFKDYLSKCKVALSETQLKVFADAIKKASSANALLDK